MDRTWNSSPNILLSDASTSTLLAKSAIWGIKAFLCGNVGGLASGLWTVVMSSDSVTANSSDNWGTSFNATKIVRAAAGVAHSWVVLQSPAGLGPVYVCLDWSLATDEKNNFIFSTNAFTGGSITNRPTATQEVVPNNTAEFQQFCDTTAAPSRQHLTLATTGEFHLLTSKNGSGQFQHHLMVSKVDNSKGNDSFRVIFSSSYMAGAPPVGLFSSSSSWSYTQTSAAIMGRNWDGSTILRGGCMQPSYNANTQIFGPSDTLGGADFNDSSYADFPMWIWHRSNSVANQSYIKGRLPDIKFWASAVADGTLDNQGGGNPEHMKAGNAAIPWTNTTAPTP